MKPEHFRNNVSSCFNCIHELDRPVTEPDGYKYVSSSCSKHNFEICRCDKYACEEPTAYICNDWEHD